MTNNSQTPLLVEEEANFKTSKVWKEQKYGYWSQWCPKPITAVLVRASSNSLDWTGLAGIQELRGDTHAHKEQGDLISLLLLFQNKESWLIKKGQWLMSKKSITVLMITILSYLLVHVFANKIISA
jgi:hypothetical protein